MVTANFSARPDTHRLRLTVTLASQNSAANTSTFNYSLAAERYSGTGTWSLDLRGSSSVTINGSTIGGPAWNYDFRNSSNTPRVIMSGSTTVGHNSNGTLTLSFSGAADSASTLGSASVSGSLSVPSLLVAPGTPISVSASRTSDTAINVSWANNSPSNGTPTTNTVRVSVNNGTFSEFSAVTVRTSQSVATAANRKNVYQVLASNGAGSSSWSGSSGAIYTTPATPTIGTATRSGVNNVITWTSNVAYSEHRHVVQHGTTLNGVITWDASDLAVVSGGTNTYTHPAPTGNQLHVYRVYASTTSGTTLNSTLSGIVEAPGRPDAPTGLVVAVDALGTAQRLVITWSAPANDRNPAGPITGYQIFFATGELERTTSGTDTTVNVDGLTPGVEYGFFVRALTGVQGVTGLNSNISYETAIGALGPPTNISATAVAGVKGAVQLTWTPSTPGDLGYIVSLNTLPTPTELQRIPGSGGTNFIHYRDRSLASYSSLGYVVSTYNTFAPNGGVNSSVVFATPNATVVQQNVPTATTNLTNQNVYSGDFPVLSATATTFTYTRNGPSLPATSVPAAFGPITNRTNDDLSGQYQIFVAGNDIQSSFFSYTKTPNAGVGDVPLGTVAAATTATNLVNPRFNGTFTVSSLVGPTAIIYPANTTAAPLTIATIPSGGIITNQSNTTYNGPRVITAVTDSTLSFPLPVAPDEDTSIAQGIIENLTNKNIFNKSSTTVAAAAAHNTMSYNLHTQPGDMPVSSGTSPYVYSNVVTAGDPGNGGLRFNSTTVANITSLRIDNVDSIGTSRPAWYATWGDNLGILRITFAATTLRFKVTAAAVDSTGFFTVPVSFIDGTLPATGTPVSVSFFPYVSGEILSPYGEVRPADSSAKLEIRYRSGWLA